MTVKEIGIKIKERRDQINIRQEDLAEMSGITTRTIYNIEEGIGNPTYETINKLCDILGMDVSINIKRIN